jgi:hypothetical protein
MLRDPRASALVTGFAAQWLGMRKAQTFLPDANIFPEFDENLRRALQRETTMFVESQIAADRSIIDLITADYSFVNERLAQHYGLRGITGERFRRVTFTDRVRGGILGQGTVLMATSYPDRTAPVVRGFWVLDSLLGMPPPPPPPDIPDLKTVTEDGRPLSMRAQMEKHRENPSCAVCHVRMDPLGFSLENFDALGRWRESSGGLRVDAMSTFPDGTPIDGVAGLRAFIVKHQDSYADVRRENAHVCARPSPDYRDQPVVREIARDAGASGHRWSAIIRGIVTMLRSSWPGPAHDDHQEGAVAPHCVARASAPRYRCHYLMRWCRRWRALQLTGTAADAFRRGLCSERRDPGSMVPNGGRIGVRVFAEPQAAGKISRSHPGHERSR